MKFLNILIKRVPIMIFTRWRQVCIDISRFAISCFRPVLHYPHLFLVFCWLNVLLFPVPSGGERAPGSWRMPRVALTALIRQCLHSETATYTISSCNWLIESIQGNLLSVLAKAYSIIPLFSKSNLVGHGPFNFRPDEYKSWRKLFSFPTQKLSFFTPHNMPLC